ncbi:hypothetical protein PHMEG_00033245, partial [Phytophthora megakarya]
MVDGSPSEIFLYLMGIKNYPVWDASVDRAEVVHTIDDHSDIIHIVYKPVWMWPIWLTPRDLCLLRYWRRAEDGSYVICMQSALHPECPAMHGLVRATCKGGGFIISPRALGVSQGDELTSMVTNVVHLDPQGWEGQLLQRLNVMHLFVRPQVLSLTGLRDVMEARKYVCPNVPEEFSAALAASTEEQNAATQEGENVTTGDNKTPVSQLEEFPSNVPRSMWAEPDGAAMMVRGPDYLTDRRKIPSQSPYFRLVGMDLFQSSETIEHIASRPDNSVQKELKRHEEQGTEMPFTFVINFVVPGTPRINLVLYYQVPHPSVLTDGSPSSELMADFLEGSDEFRNERFKLIPCIVEGSFIVRQAVGSTPALIGKKLRQPTFHGKQYFELDVDIGSSAVANRVVGLVSGYAKKLVIDMGFVLEGQSPDELPERLFGSARLVHIDLSIAKKLSYIFADLDALNQDMCKYMRAHSKEFSDAELTKHFPISAYKLTKFLSHPDKATKYFQGSYYYLKLKDVEAFRAVGWEMRPKSASKYRTLGHLPKPGEHENKAKTLVLVAGKLAGSVLHGVDKYFEAGWCVHCYCFRDRDAKVYDRLVSEYPSQFKCVYLNNSVRNLVKEISGDYDMMFTARDSRPIPIE